MRDKVVDKIMLSIEYKNTNLNDVKLAEVRYGLQSLYSLITKTLVIVILAIIFKIFFKFIIFMIFYSIIRSVSYGTHAISNIRCWIFSILFLLGFPYLFSVIYISEMNKLILWAIVFLNFIIFSPSDTKKRPMINKKRKFKFKIISLIICLLYLPIIYYFKSISNLLLGALVLEGLLINPIGYLIMGEEVRFRLNDINIFKLN